MTVTSLQDTRTELEAIHNTVDTAERERLLNDFHRRRHHQYQTWTRRLIKGWNIHRSYHDDVFQHVQLEVHQLVLAWDGTIASWEGWAYKWLRKRVCDEFDAGRWAPSQAAGTINVQRRRRRLEKLRPELAQTLGREPSNSELVAEHNRRLENHPNARKHGLIASVLDLGVAAAPAEYGDWLDPDTRTPEDPIVNVCVLSTVEGPVFVKMVLDASEAMSPTHAAVANVWIGDFPVVVESPQQISFTTGVPKTTVRRKLKALRIEAAQILLEQFGVSADDWQQS